MACQLRFSTSTVAFVNMFINLQTTTASGRLGVCSLLKSARIKLAATAGNAPALPVSETGVQTSTLSGKMVAREGAAPPISGCRPDVILFHHRAETGCRGWTLYVTGGVMCSIWQKHRDNLHLSTPASALPAHNYSPESQPRMSGCRCQEGACFPCFGSSFSQACKVLRFISRSIST